jgi:predicted Fe-S protein YdhL (DUF1289 family)
MLRRTPCIGICSTTYGDLVCRGCKRFAHEIVEWNGYSDSQQVAVWSRLETLRQGSFALFVEVVDAPALRTAARGAGCLFSLVLSPPPPFTLPPPARGAARKTVSHRSRSVTATCAGWRPSGVRRRTGSSPDCRFASPAGGTMRVGSSSRSTTNSTGAPSRTTNVVSAFRPSSPPAPQSTKGRHSIWNAPFVSRSSQAQ